MKTMNETELKNNLFKVLGAVAHNNETVKVEFEPNGKVVMFGGKAAMKLADFDVWVSEYRRTLPGGAPVQMTLADLKGLPNQKHR